MRRIRSVALAVAAICTVPAFGQATDILVLHSHNASLPWVQGFRRGLQDAQERHSDVRYYSEYLDTRRTGAAMTDDQWVEYLRTKYAAVDVDAIVADSGRAAALVYGYPQLFGPIPQVIYTPNPQPTPPYQLTMTPQIEDAVTRTAAIALAQNPGTRTALVIDGGNTGTQATIGYLRSILAADGIEVEVIRDFTLPGLQRTLRNAPDGTVAFYTLVFQDVTGTQFIPREFLRQLARESAVPIYSFWGTLTGTGVVGGRMIDSRVAARQAVEAVFGYYASGAFGRDYATAQTYIDWRAIQRHGIAESSIPPNAVVINRPDPFLARYYKEAATVATIVLFLALLVLGILYRRNVVVSRALRQSLDRRDALYREMNNRIKNTMAILSSLITLQMDNLSEESVKTQLGTVMSRLQTLALIHEELSAEDSSLRTNIRSYLGSLVPQVLRAALPGFPEDQVQIEVESFHLDTRDAVALGLMVHELVTNAAKFAVPYGQSVKIGVSLTLDDGDVAVLSVTDTGPGLPDGFDISREAQLGLRIVQSLPLQFGGSVRAKNRNRGGARFSVTIPV